MKIQVLKIPIANAYLELRSERLLLDEGPMWQDDEYELPVDLEQESKDDFIVRMIQLIEQRVEGVGP